MLKELLIEKTPKYIETLPITNKKVTYRPFLVREEKNLMISKETSSFENLMMTVRDVINSCVTDMPTKDCKDLPFCDLEYIFLKIREKSLGEVVECVITCPVTKETITSTLDLRQVKITNKVGSSKVKLDNNITVVMQQPTMSTYLELNKFGITEEEDGVFKLLALTIKEIHTNNEVYYTKDNPLQETLEFVENLTTKQFANLIKFIKEVPTIEQSIKYKTSDNVERELKLRGFSDFLELFLVMRI